MCDRFSVLLPMITVSSRSEICLEEKRPARPTHKSRPNQESAEELGTVSVVSSSSLSLSVYFLGNSAASVRSKQPVKLEARKERSESSANN